MVRKEFKDERRFDRYGEFRSIAFAEGHVMCRRKGRMVVVMSQEEWDAMARENVFRETVIRLRKRQG